MMLHTGTAGGGLRDGTGGPAAVAAVVPAGNPLDLLRRHGDL